MLLPPALLALPSLSDAHGLQRGVRDPYPKEAISQSPWYPVDLVFRSEGGLGHFWRHPDLDLSAHEIVIAPWDAPRLDPEASPLERRWADQWTLRAATFFTEAFRGLNTQVGAKANRRRLALHGRILNLRAVEEEAPPTYGRWDLKLVDPSTGQVLMVVQGEAKEGFSFTPGIGVRHRGMSAYIPLWKKPSQDVLLLQWARAFSSHLLVGTTESRR